MLYNEVLKSGEKIPYIYEVHEVPPTHSINREKFLYIKGKTY